MHDNDGYKSVLFSSFHDNIKKSPKTRKQQYYQHRERGVYSCIHCHEALFSSEHKYDSGSGWPCYWKPISRTAITEIIEYENGAEYVEVRCSKCSSSLGHRFTDGPEPTGLRYCINATALDFSTEVEDESLLSFC